MNEKEVLAVLKQARRFLLNPRGAFDALPSMQVAALFARVASTVFAFEQIVSDQALTDAGNRARFMMVEENWLSVCTTGEIREHLTRMCEALCAHVPAEQLTGAPKVIDRLDTSPKPAAVSSH